MHTFLFLLILISLSVFVSAQNCTDSDNGIDYYTRGTIIWGNITGADLCEGETLTEFFCDPDFDEPIDKQYNCPNGCLNGACVEETETCSETDGGLDYFSRGVITVGDDVSEDICTDSNFLKEYACSLTENDYYDNYYCQNGCEDGVCVEKADICTDSDNGIDIYTQGVTKLGNETRSDECINDDEVEDYYCDIDFGEESIHSRSESCPSGCEGGACIRENHCIDSDGGGR